MYSLSAIKVKNNITSQRKGAEILLTNELKKYFNIDYRQVEIKRTSSGKPYIDGRDDVYFNISHSNEYTVCVVCDVMIGVDIQMNQPINQRVREKFLNNCAPEDAIKLWTERESFGKMTGIGFMDTDYENNPHRFIHYECIENYRLTVCVSLSGAGGFVMSDSDFPKDITWYQEQQTD